MHNEERKSRSNIYVQHPLARSIRLLEEYSRTSRPVALKVLRSRRGLTGIHAYLYVTNASPQPLSLSLRNRPQFPAQPENPRRPPACPFNPNTLRKSSRPVLSRPVRTHARRERRGISLTRMIQVSDTSSPSSFYPLPRSAVAGGGDSLLTNLQQRDANVAIGRDGVCRGGSARSLRCWLRGRERGRRRSPWRTALPNAPPHSRLHGTNEVLDGFCSDASSRGFPDRDINVERA